MPRSGAMSKPPPTATLAEMYLRQGLVGRAREIFRAIERGEDPVAAQRATQRLSELGPSAARSIALLRSLLGRIQEKRRSGRP
ncbi:MAG: hypothetical protein NVS2B9_07350 [Myxococcales bacterium]